MVGFALWHIHPGFAVAGILCSLALAVWLLISIPYDHMCVAASISLGIELIMIGTLMVILALAAPATFFASGR